jgi:hypothetical protein
VALPFLRTPLVPAAIAIGAMTPDVPLFFRVGISYGVTHDWLGALLVDLPLALSLLILWRTLLRTAVPAVSPRWLRERLPADWFDGSAVGWRSLWPGGVVAVLLLVASLLIGIASHILWDLFTHPGRWGSEVLPVIAERWGPLDGTQWLQYASSAFGLILLGVWALLWLRRRTPEHRPDAGPRWAGPVFWLATLACLVVSAVVELSFHGVPDRAGLSQALFRWGVPAGSAILLLALVVAIAAAIRRSRRPRHN